MNEEFDLTDWIADLDKQIASEQFHNKAPFRACRDCGDKGFHLERVKDNGMWYLSTVICDCTSGHNLVARWNTKTQGVG
jgi:hypothetical protein